VGFGQQGKPEHARTDRTTVSRWITAFVGGLEMSWSRTPRPRLDEEALKDGGQDADDSLRVDVGKGLDSDDIARQHQTDDLGASQCHAQTWPVRSEVLGDRCEELGREEPAVRGVIGWTVWLAIHLMHLVRHRSRVVALFT
jgi:hypothetical protein